MHAEDGRKPRWKKKKNENERKERNTEKECVKEYGRAKKLETHEGSYLATVMYKAIGSINKDSL